jgi:hypothetical protein
MSTTVGYIDYLFKTTDQGQIVAALTALRATNPAASINMLGDPILDVDGNTVAQGRMGRAALSYTDSDTAQVVNVPAAGDPTYWYAALRVSADVVFDPATFGMTVCDPAENAAVLGVWA